MTGVAERSGSIGAGRGLVRLVIGIVRPGADKKKKGSDLRVGLALRLIERSQHSKLLHGFLQMKSTEFPSNMQI